MSSDVDVVVVGGGTAGLSAALVLGRTRIRTVVLDAGLPRNTSTPHAHNFLTQDGTTPSEMLAIARKQIADYDSVHIVDEAAETVTKSDSTFEVKSVTGRNWSAKRLVLATGLIDELPPIEGFRERWGVSVLHCPFCHGWEVRDKALVVYGNGPSGYELSWLAKGWSDRVTLCTDGPLEMTSAQAETLKRNGIEIIRNRVKRVEGAGIQVERLVFEDREPLPCESVFVRSIRKPRSDLAVKLGCAVLEGGFIDVDDFGQTSVPGAYAAGDAIEPGMQILTFAAFSGSRTGIGVAKSLLAEQFESANS